MSNEQQERPYKVLGEKLKSLRQKMHESVAEVSGAVEIDEQALLKIEQGQERPSEDILMLLINHFWFAGRRRCRPVAARRLRGMRQP
jgi:hypothetical protein